MKILLLSNTSSFFLKQSLNGERKKALKDVRVEGVKPKVWSDFSLEVLDKTLVNMFTYCLKSNMIGSLRKH